MKFKYEITKDNGEKLGTWVWDRQLPPKQLKEMFDNPYAMFTNKTLPWYKKLWYKIKRLFKKG